jgi:hypothetical protein
MRDLVNLFKIILFAIGIFLALIIGLIIFVTMHGTDVSNITSSISINKTIVTNSTLDNIESEAYTNEDSKELVYYDTVEEAISNKDMLDKSLEIADYVILKQVPAEDDDIYIICAVEIESTMGQGISRYKLKKKNGQYSQPFEFLGIEGSMKKFATYRYDLDDYISQAIVWELINGIYVKSEHDGIGFFFSWDNKDEVYELTINSKKPTDIIEYELNGKTYYYFDFLDADFVQQLFDKVNFGSYTLQQVSDAIEIKYKK